jgi:hypothetical protein
MSRAGDARGRLAARAAAAAVAVCLGAARPAWAALETDPGRFVPVEELRPGDRCTGRTVFSGDAVEEFDVEILGVVRGTGPQSDLIIARASGGPLAETGILEGMSGSPVYLGDRLVGAISSTWAFSKEAIAGVTPIGQMLPALALFDGERPSGGGPGGAYGTLVVPPAERPASRGSWLAAAAGLPAGAPPAARPAGAFEGREMAGIPLPLVVSGGSDGFLKEVAGVLAGTGLSAVRGARGGPASAEAPARGAPGGEALPEGAAEPVPGSAVGVQLVRGDANWTAVGTLTYRDGDRVIAFGHPMFQGGEIELPLVRARVHALMPLQSVSFKYATGTDLIGTMLQDRRHMVAGRLGAPPTMVDLAVSVTVGESGPRDFRLQVARARPYAAVFSGLATAQVLDEVVRAAGPAAVELHARVTTDAGVVEYADVLESDDLAFRVGGELAALLDIIASNGFEPRDVSAVDVDVRVFEEERRAEIERVDAGRTSFRPGEDVTVAVTLRHWRGPRVTETMTLHVPDSAPDGRYVLRVSGAADYRAGEGARLGEGLRPRTYEQLVSLIERSRPGNAVVAQLLSEEPGLSLSGEEMRAVPHRVALAMVSSAVGGVVDPATASCVAESETRVDREVRGAREIVVTVERRP